MPNDDRILIMPFITVQSHGGPHDDQSYVCGYEMGYLDARLAVISALGAIPTPQTFHLENLPQIDLIAMQYNLRTTIKVDDDEWVHVTFISTEDEDAEDDD